MNIIFRTTKRALHSGALLVACTFAVILWSDRTSFGDDQPNVVMISIDDLNDWTGFLGGHPDVSTPNMDELAEQGRSFSNAHCAVPVCSSSRVSVMSGLAPTTHGSYEIGPRYDELPALNDVPTMQRYFKDHGYYTVAGGKVLHHGFTGRLSEAIDQALGREKGRRPKNIMNKPFRWSGAWDWGQYPDDDTQMADYQLAQKAANFLQSDIKAPFFLSVGFFRPHVPLFVPPCWFEQYDIEAINLPDIPSWDLDDVPKNFLNINSYAVAPTHAEVLKYGKQRELTQAYLASISFVDSCVGCVVDALRASPHAKNTYIVLWSDHGFHLGEKNHWAKRTLWEESTRVPLLISGPGILPDASCEQSVSLIDIYPTLIDLCGLPQNKKLEGISLVPQLEDSRTVRDRPAITSSYFGNHAVRSQFWRLIVYEDGAQELYDHRSDPDEFHNLADDPRYTVIKKKLRQWLPKSEEPEFRKKSEREKRRKE